MDAARVLVSLTATSDFDKTRGVIQERDDQFNERGVDKQNSNEQSMINEDRRHQHQLDDPRSVSHPQSSRVSSHHHYYHNHNMINQDRRYQPHLDDRRSVSRPQSSRASSHHNHYHNHNKINEDRRHQPQFNDRRSVSHQQSLEMYSSWSSRNGVEPLVASPLPYYGHQGNMEHHLCSSGDDRMQHNMMVRIYSERMSLDVLGDITLMSFLRLVICSMAPKELLL